MPFTTWRQLPGGVQSGSVQGDEIDTSLDRVDE